MAEQISSLKSLADFLGEQDIKVVVPKIQRAYAQGRKSEENIRSQFVEELFTALEEDKTIELSFVYGSKVKSQDGKYSRFELLDGQQRITTLVLLHWFLACVSGKDIPQFIKAFNYETRTTSETFLKRLADNPLDIVNEKPSDSLRNRQWYTLSFDKDNSVRGMLCMLDAFYFRYLESQNKEQLYDNLHNIKFYELDLDDFGLTEEIYVKMNARGLQLTPFENFKADLIKLLKDETITEFNKVVEMDIAGHPTVPYYLNISQKIDNRWLDLFWSHEDVNGRDYCDRFFRFFYRFFTTKYFLEIQKNLKADSFRPVAQPNTEESKIWNFLWVLSDRQDRTYFGFKYYDKFFRDNPVYMSEIEHVLDTFSNPEYLKVIREESIYPWEKIEKRQAQFFEKNYQLTDAVYFAAVCEYIIRSIENFDVANFRRWMRVVRNIVENILFRNVDEVVRLVRRLVVILDLPDAMINVYKALASDNMPTERESRTLKEEMQKAKIICNNTTQDWESAFITAEAHPFFRGAIGFMLEDLPDTVEDFLHRNEILSQLFDENGMTDYAKYNHRLIRSMVRLLSTRPLLKETALTEREDRTHHLKAMMLEKEPIRIFLSKLGDKNNIEDVVGYLDEYCDNPTIDFSHKEAELIPAEPDIRFIRALTRLCLDNRLYDFIHDVEHRERVKHVEVSFRDDNIAIARPRSWYDWIFLGTERASIINDMLTLGYYFINEFKDPFYNRAEFYDNYGDYWGFRVWVYKDINETKKLTVEFHQSGKARFLYKSDDTLAESVFPNSTVHDMWNEWRIICEVDGSEMTDLPGILTKAEEVEKALVDANEKSESMES